MPSPGYYKQFLRAEKQFAHYLVTGQQSAAKIAKDFYEESLERMSQLLSETKTEYDLFAIGIAIILLYLVRSHRSLRDKKYSKA